MLVMIKNKPTALNQDKEVLKRYGFGWFWDRDYDLEHCMSGELLSSNTNCCRLVQRLLSSSTTIAVV